MKQSTSFAQVATNLLNVLQGYTKGIRLLLVMFLTLTVSAEVWGADYSKNEVWNFTTTGNSNWSGHNSDYCGACGSKSTAFNVYKTNITNFSNIDFSKYENVSLTIYVKAGTNSGTNSYTVKLIDANGNQVSTYTSTKSSGMGTGSNSSSAKESSVTFSPTVAFNGYKIEFPAKAYITQTRYVLTYEDKAASYTITAESNNTSYGTVTLSGTKITASPKTGYRVSTTTPYTISPSNSAKVTQNGNTFTVAPTANTTITINFETIPTYTVNWYVNGTKKHTQTATAGTTLTNIPTPTTADCDNSKVFVGWTTTADYSNATTAPSGMITNTSGMTMPEGDENYHAVFATEEDGGGTTEIVKTETFSNQTSHASESNWKQSLTWNATESNIGVEWSTYYGKILANDDYVEIRTYSDKNMGYIWSSQKIKGLKSIQFNGWHVTESDAADMVVSYSKNNDNDWVEIGTHTAGSTSSSQSAVFTIPDAGVNDEYYISIDLSNATCPSSSNKKYRIDNISLTILEGSGSTTSYSDYMTSCTTETTVTLNPNGGEIDNNNWTFENGVYKLTTNDESITLPEITRTGYTFGGWATSAGGPKAHDNGATITLNGTPVTLYAIWTPITYTITYELDGGTNHASNPANYTIETSTITLQAPNKDRHTFVGWYKESTFATQVTQIAKGSTGNITLYAKWVEIPTTCTVTYHVNGGIGTPPSDETKYTNGATVTVQGNYGALTKDGYAFTGWNTEADGTGNPYKHGDQFTITSNTTLYAQWCEAYWKLVTDASELENDTRIVIAAKDYNVALSTTQNEANRGQAEITKKYNTTTFDENNVQILSLVDVTNNRFALYTGSGYLYAASKSANQLKTQDKLDDNAKWSIAISQGAALILAQGDKTHNQIKYNHQQSGQLFSCYETSNTTMSAVTIYKEVCVQDQYYVKEPKLTNATAANDNPTTVASTAKTLTLIYTANTGYLLPETITVKMGGVELTSGTDYNWNKETGALTITVTGFYGDIDVKIDAETDPCYGFAMSEVAATSTTNSITLIWNAVDGATGYNVKLGTGDFTAATGTSHTFTGLSPKTDYTWEVQAIKDGANFHCEASKTGTTPTQKETFTVSWVVNGDTENPVLTEFVVDGEKITKYPSTEPSAPSGCSTKVFVGWTNQPIPTETNETPTLYTELKDIPAITANTPLYAVWADKNEVPGEKEPAVETIISKGLGYDSGDAVESVTSGVVNIAFNKGNNSNVPKYYSTGEAIRTYGGNYFTITSDNTITSVKLTFASGEDANAITTDVETYSDGTWTGSANSVKFTVSGSTGHRRISKFAVTYLVDGEKVITYSAYTTLCDECTPSTLTLEADNTTADLDINGEATITFSTTTGGNGGAITYAANPKTGVTWDNGTATFTKAGDYTITASQEKNGEYCPTTSNTVNVTITAIPHLYFVTEPANPIEFEAVECGGNTALANKKSVELQGYNLTGNVTVNVTGAYKIARTSSANLGEYSTSLTLDKTDAGKINGNYDVVYILSCPPAGGTASTEGTLTFTTQGGEQLTVNLSTPTVTCTPRTLTFNDRGNITTQKYYAGAEVPQPEDPTGVCTIPVNYVFDGWAEAEVTDGSTSYTKVNFPYSMPAQNTTLYAVYRYTEENANSDKFMSVDKELGELVSGMDYVLTGYYDADNYEYAMSINTYETGKYKTKFVDVQESSILYEEDIPYYEFTTTDNEIIWTIEGDDTNGYTFQNKTNNKFLAVEDEKLALSDNAAKFTIEHETGVENNDEEVYYMSLLIQPVGSTKYLSSYYKKEAASVLFNLHTTSTLSLYLYKRVASNLYTTSPDCGGITITYDFAGGDGGHCTDTRVEGGSDYTICEDVPTKTGYTFLHWSDGANTYNPSDVIENVTADITLTAIWQINTYTVIWSNNGVTTPVTYEHGDDLTLPSAPASCDGVKEFVGWTADNTFTYHATTPPSDIFTEKTATVTADATYYAVFATKGEGSANFVLGESGTFKMYANVEGTNYYAQGGVSSNKITSTTEAANASDYTLTYADGVYTIKQGTSNVGNKTDDANLNTNETTWTISEGTNGSWRVTSNVSTSRALSYSTSASAFKAYSISNITGSPTIYYDIEFGGISSGYSDYTTTCQQIESIEVQSPQTEFYITDDFTIGSGKVIATLSGGGTTDVTALATFSGYNMNEVGSYTVTVTYMGATATYEITVKPLDNAWVLTWNVSGKTNTGLGPRSVTKGAAIGTLPTPVVPDACEGKTFIGWTTSNIVNSDGTGITYITEETVPADNTTYYAVFATVNNFCTQKPLNEITNGSKVVIVAIASLTADGGSGKAISSRATDDTYNLQGDSVAILEEHINTPHSTCIWTVTIEDGKYIFTQDGKYLNGAKVDSHYNLKYNDTKDTWTLTSVAGKDNTYHMKSTQTSYFAEFFKGKFTLYKEANDLGDFDMQFFVVAGNGADITDYTTGCTEYTITYYGFRGGYSTSTSSDGIIVLPVNSMHTVPDCGDVVKDHTNLGREFLDVWMTQPHGGHTFKPGDTFILTQDTTLYAQWKMETTSDVTTLPTDIEDLAGTDVYVYGGKTLNIQPGTTTINSLTLKGGLQSDGSYKMPIVWVPEGATLVRNSNKIYLDLVVNAKNYYPFAVPFATKNDQYIDYLDPVLNKASTYGTHFVIKTYDGARRADVGEDRANNWVKVLRHATDKPSSLQPGVGYIIQALTYPDKDTATIRIPMTVPNTWFKNGEQAVVGSTARNTIAVTAHGGAAADKHQRHAGWNFVASPYLTNFAGGNVENNGGLEYINGELTVNGGWQYGGDDVPYVTIPAYDFSYYTQHKLSDVKLSPEWSFFVQIGKDGTMDFSTAGRQETPASIAARHDAAQSFKMDVDITLSDKNHSDQMGLIICDHFSSAYEVGYDLEKMFGSAYNLTVYTLMEDNTPLAYHALAIHSNMQVIPVGYRVPEQGDYTFALNQSTSSIDLLNEQYEQLILVDYETGALTNLLKSTYTFTSPRTQSDSRFAIYAVIRQKTPTDLPNIDDGDTSTRKILHNGHLYILRDGKVYNGNGQIVKQ